MDLSIRMIKDPVTNAWSEQTATHSAEDFVFIDNDVADVDATRFASEVSVL
jgi:hypothetical protein